MEERWSSRAERQRQAAFMLGGRRSSCSASLRARRSCRSLGEMAACSHRQVPGLVRAFLFTLSSLPVACALVFAPLWWWQGMFAGSVGCWQPCAPDAERGTSPGPPPPTQQPWPAVSLHQPFRASSSCLFQGKDSHSSTGL